jgi:predicted alpha/beta-hydrolase family hydrolase
MAQRLILLAHGAGAPCSSPWMRGWASRLSELGHVVCFDYPYMVDGRRRPDPQPKLVDAHRRALAQARARHDGPLVLVGKSMGGRIGCHVALEEPVDALICLGYPLRGARKTANVRDQVLLELRTPVLFVQGTRDALCPLELLASVRERMRASNQLYVVDDGNHSLEPTRTFLRTAGETQADVDSHILDRIRSFLDQYAT